MKRVVVIGGGFAGTTVAKKLQNKCKVTLFDTEDFFEYTPGILRVLVEPKHYEKIHVKHKDALARTNVVIGHVLEIKDKFISLTNGKKLNYDYLIIASGSNYNSPIKEEDTFFATRVKHLLEAHKKIQNYKNIVIVGGGLVGVELIAELATHYKEKKITLIHSGPRLMERNNTKTRAYAKRFLEGRGVKIIFNETINSKSRKKLIGKSGKEYDYDVAFFTVGIKPNVSFMKGDFSSYIEKGIVVNEYLQLSNRNKIFVAGDVSNIAEEKTAQNAENHGKVVAYNVLASIEGKKMKKYVSKKRLMVISLGKYSGIIEYKKFVITGWIPALLKFLIERKVMYNLRR